jgi:hypothetical protein
LSFSFATVVGLAPVKRAARSFPTSSAAGTATGEQHPILEQKLADIARDCGIGAARLADSRRFMSAPRNGSTKTTIPAGLADATYAVSLTDVRVEVTTGDALIEQKTSVLPPKPDMRVTEYTP